MNASISVICYKYKTLSNGEHPIMLRVHKDNKRKMISLGVSVNYNDWDFTKNEPKPKCPNRELIQKVILDKKTEYYKQVLELNAEQKDYTAASLVESKTEKFTLKTVREFYEELISNYGEIGKTGNRRTYKASLNCLKRFTANKLDIFFSDINVAWLNRYEDWFRQRKCKETFMSVQFRTLRSAYNKAIVAKATSCKNYPFAEFKVSKFNVKTKKRALTKEDVMKIITTETINPTPIRTLTRSFFTFSYLCAGIPFVDFANLKPDNIVKGKLSYVRQKTHGEINVTICDQALEIVDRYESYCKEAKYLFPVFDARVHKTPQQKANRINKVCNQVNKELKVLADELEIDAEITTYVARHTFATILKRSGVNIGIISELMGHADLTTTEIYLDGFDEEQVEQAMSNLL